MPANRIRTLLDGFGIKVIADGQYEQDDRNRIVAEKPNEYKKVIDHAIVVPRSLPNGCYRGASESRNDNDEVDGRTAAFLRLKFLSGLSATGPVTATENHFFGGRV